MSSSGVSPLVYEKAVNAVYFSSIFLKYLIESVQGDIQLYLSLEDDEAVPKDVLRGMYDTTLCFRYTIKPCNVALKLY